MPASRSAHSLTAGMGSVNKFPPGKGNYLSALPTGWATNPSGLPEGSARGISSPELDEARQLILDFAARTIPTAFPGLSRDEVAEGLMARIEDPGLLNQGPASTCGPANLLFDIANRRPLEFARFGVELYENGQGTIGRLVIRPGRDLRAYRPPPGSINHADWLLMASIRDSENWFFDYDEVGDQVAGITLPGELAEWFQKAGYTDVRNETNLLLTKGLDNLREADELGQQGFRVCLFINSNMLYAESQNNFSLTPDHWVVLTSRMQFTNPGELSVQFTVFSWGLGRRTVPQFAGSFIPVNALLKNYYGYVAARL